VKLHNHSAQKYLVTGGEGFIGSKLVQKTSGLSFDIKSGYDILDTKKLQKEIASIASTGDAGGIFHCAAKISVPESIQFPEEYYRTNVEGTRSVIKAAEAAKAVGEIKAIQRVNQKIIFSSSAAVYGEVSLPVNESFTLNPKSPYGENKTEGEELLRKVLAPPSIVLRYQNVYGPGQSSEYAGVITIFILSALKGLDIVIFGDGGQVRDFVFVDDVVDANIAAMNYRNKSFEIFNIGSGVGVSINKLAKTIIKLTNSSSRIVYKPARLGDIVFSQADISKAKNILGWAPKVSFEDGLRQTISYYRKQV